MTRRRRLRTLVSPSGAVAGSGSGGKVGKAAVAAVLLVGTLVATCAATGASARPAGKSPKGVIVFNGEGNNLNAYAAEPPFTKQTVIRNHDDDPQGLDINAQICFFPGGSNRFIAGEDTGQPNPPQGWGIFQLRGGQVGKLSAKQVGKLTPTYQPSSDNPENYGCGFLSDGRVVTTDIGDQRPGQPPNGQLIVWFPPFNSRNVRYCKVDVGIATAGGIFVDKQDRVHVPSGRSGPPEAGVYRYSGPFPTSDNEPGGCGSTDSTGAPMTTSVNKELFIRLGDGLSSPIAIVRAPKNGFYASSVITGIINEYDANGGFVRSVLQPPASETLGEQTFSTGTPLGLGVGPDGTLYFADIGITITGEGIGPGPEGTVRRIRFVRGQPQPPETMGGGLAFPDGIGVYVPKKK
jgi:hypothetical protein